MEVARLEKTRAECSLPTISAHAQGSAILMNSRRLSMKHLMLVCLLAMSAVAAAQTPTTTTSAEEVKREADEAKTRARLDDARARLDKAAQEVADLSMQLGRDAMGGDERVRTIRITGIGASSSAALDNAAQIRRARAALARRAGVRGGLATGTSSSRSTEDRFRCATTRAAGGRAHARRESRPELRCAAARRKNKTSSSGAPIML